MVYPRLLAAYIKAVLSANLDENGFVTKFSFDIPVRSIESRSFQIKDKMKFQKV